MKLQESILGHELPFRQAILLGTLTTTVLMALSKAISPRRALTPFEGVRWPNNLLLPFQGTASEYALERRQQMTGEQGGRCGE